MAKKKLIRDNAQTNSYLNKLQKYYVKYVNYEYFKSLLIDPVQLPIVSIGILLVELILNIFIVHNVKYTEIDWIAYMQECEGFLNGTTNYKLLRGDTGPLVYPAGFLYIYSILYFITSAGQNIRLAQYIFIGIYLLQMYLVLNIYGKSQKIPPYVLLITTFTSYRIHSIYVLRLFNDPIAILCAYAAINLFLNEKWLLGSVCFSIGVSIKMNILLFAPAILLLYLINLGYWKTFVHLSVCVTVQLILGAPFLITHPIEYIKGSFDLGRIFEHKWTVNYRFLDETIFQHKYFHIGLLILHILLLIFVILPSYSYLRNYCRLRELQRQMQPQIDAKNRELVGKGKNSKKQQKNKTVTLSNDEESFLHNFENSLKHQQTQQRGNNKKITTITSNVADDSTVIDGGDFDVKDQYKIHFDKSIQLAILPIFLINFIGIMCARSLHYQFYVWYFHSLPYLVWYTNYNKSQKFLILGLLEYAWNTYPSTNLSSLLLHVSHLSLFIGICKRLYEMKNIVIK